MVASEVRSLAQRSANAAKEIKGLIANSVDKVEAGDDTITDLDQATQQNTALVEETAAAADMARQAKLLAETVSVFRTCQPEGASA